MRRPRFTFRRVMSGLTILSSLFMVACLGAPLYAMATNAHVYVISGGSMEPTYKVGDAVLVRKVDVSQLRVGQIVTYKPVGSGKVVTHRISAIYPNSETPTLQTKGDANAAPDPSLLPAPYVLGEPGMRLPFIGHLVMMTISPMSRLLVFGLPLSLIAFEQVLALFRRPSIPTLDIVREVA